MMEFCLPEYTYEDFCKITVTLLAKRNNLGVAIAMKIADVVWNQMNSRDIRNVLQLGKIVTSINEVEETARTLMKYSQKKRGSEDEE